MAEFPIMPMFWDAYFGDTTHLTCLEHGAYLQLLGAMWRAGGDLVDDDVTLMRLTHLTRAQWKRIRPRIMAFMHPIAGGRFTQDKLLQTLNAVRRRSKSAQANINARWLKKKGLADTIVSKPYAISTQNQNQIEPSFLPLSLSPREKKKEAAEGERAKPPEIIPVSEALAAKYRQRKAS